MARVGLGDELEHIDLDSDAPTPPRERRPWPRRRVAVLAVAVAVIAALLGPVRTATLEHGFRHLEGIYLESQALSAARAEAYALVFRRAALHDQGRLTTAAAHLFTAEERAQARLRQRLDDDWRVGLDGGLRRLRSALEPVIRRDPPFQPLERARELLASTRRRLGLDPQPRPQVSLRAAVADDLEALARYFDAPTGTRLIVATNTALYEIDIDASHTTRLAPDGFESGADTELFGRDGWTLARTSRGSFALSADFTRATPLPGNWTWPSVRADAVWTATRSDMRDRTEIDSAGRVLRGPFHLAANLEMTNAVESGLVVQDVDGGNRFQIWDPERQRTVSSFSGFPLAVSGDLVLRLDRALGAEDEIADVVDAGTGRVLTELGPSPPMFRAAFSPDGRRVAVAGDRVARVIDVATGRSRDVPGSVVPTGSQVVWSPSGRFVFFAEGGVIAAWEVDGGLPTVLRVSADLGYRVSGLVALAAEPGTVE